jgi:hypothetical protein
MKSRKDTNFDVPTYATGKNHRPEVMAIISLPKPNVENIAEIRSMMEE